MWSEREAVNDVGSQIIGKLLMATFKELELNLPDSWEPMKTLEQRDDMICIVL